MWTLLAWLTIPFLAQHRLRSLLVCLSVTVAVATAVGFDLTGRSVVASAHSAVDAVAGRAELTISNAESGVPEAVLATARETPGVAAAVPIEELAVSTVGLDGEQLELIGLDLLEEEQTRKLLDLSLDANALGDPLELLALPGSILLTKTFAARHHLDLEDTIRLLTPRGVQPFRVAGLLEPSGAARGFGGNLAVMDIFAAQKAFGRAGAFGRIDVLAEGDVDAVARALTARIAPAATVAPSGQRHGHLLAVIDGISLTMRAAGIVGLVVAMFMIFTAQSIAVVKRRREIAMVRALGLTSGRLRMYLVAEAVMLAIPAALLGLPLGWLLARAGLPIVGDTIAASLGHLGAVPLATALPSAAATVALALGVAALGAFVPATVTARLPLVEALSHGRGIEQPERDARAAAAGVGLVAIALGAVAFDVVPAQYGWVLLLPAATLGSVLALPELCRRLGTPVQSGLRRVAPALGLVAGSSLTTASRLSAGTVGMIMMATAAVTALRIVLGGLNVAAEQWGERFFPLQLMVTSGSPIFSLRANLLDGTVVEQLRNVPGVADVNPIRIIDGVSASGLAPYLVAQDVTLWAGRGGRQVLVDGEPQAVTAALARGEVLVSEVLASKAGVRRGGTVTVQTPAGVAALRVAGVYSAGFLANPDGALQMDASTFRRLWADDRATTVTLFLEPTARADDVAAAIQRAFGESHGVFVIDYDDFRALGLNRLAQPYHLAQAMNVLVAMMAGFGVLSTLLASVLDRQREISLLRSVGATRGQVAIGVLAEALLLGALGLVVGCLLGMLGARVLVNIFDVFNWHVPFVVPVGALVVELTLILLVVLAAGWYPARRAGGLALVEGLAAE